MHSRRIIIRESMFSYIFFLSVCVVLQFVRINGYGGKNDANFAPPQDRRKCSEIKFYILAVVKNNRGLMSAEMRRN